MLKYVQDTKNEYVEFLKKLVSIRSYSGEEKELSECLVEAFKEIGVDEAFTDGVGNAVAIIRGTGEGPNIVLSGHMDIVPEGNVDLWVPFKPYEPEIVDGKMYGRGTSDMKEGLAAVYCAMKAIMENVVKKGQRLSGDITFCGVVQEEPAVMLGMKYFLEHTMEEHDIKCDVVYIAEPSNNNLTTGQRGKMELVVKTYGKCAHSSAPEEGINALEHMIPVLKAIFEKDGITLLEDAAGKTCLTVTNIEVKPGGTLSCIPDECEISIDRRFTPEQSDEDIIGEFEAIFAKLQAENPEFKATVEPRYFDMVSWTGYEEKARKWHPSWQMDRDNEYVVRAFKALEGIGQTPKEQYSKGGTDGSMTCAIHKIPTIIYSGGEGSVCHKEKEWVDIEEAVKGYEGYVAIIADLYGLDLKLFD